MTLVEESAMLLVEIPSSLVLVLLAITANRTRTVGKTVFLPLKISKFRGYKIDEFFIRYYANCLVSALVLHWYS